MRLRILYVTTRPLAGPSQSAGSEIMRSIMLYKMIHALSSSSTNVWIDKIHARPTKAPRWEKSSRSNPRGRDALEKLVTLTRTCVRTSTRQVPSSHARETDRESEFVAAAHNVKTILKTAQDDGQPPDR